MFTKHGLIEGRIQRRYQRFLADVILLDGKEVTAHCTNTGTMKTVWVPNDKVLLEPAQNKDRKLPFTWIACERDENWIGVDTGIPNKVIAEAARTDSLPGLTGLHDVRTEVKYGTENSRIDVLARDESEQLVYIEVKNTTLRIGSHACFPDAVSERGLKHLRELQGMVRDGHRAAIVFFVHRSDVTAFDAAREIDPVYAEELDRAQKAGVLVLPVQVKMDVQPDGESHWSIQWTLNGLYPFQRRLDEHLTQN